MSVVLVSASSMIAGFTVPVALRNRKFVLGGAGVGFIPRPTDPIGTFTLTLQNIVIGSLWEIEVASVQGTSLRSGTVISANVVITLNSYQSGSANNSLRIKVRNASGTPYYQSFETQTNAFSGATSIFINQVRDDI